MVSFRIRLIVETLSAAVILLVAVPLVLPRHYIMEEVGNALCGPAVLMSAQLVARSILVRRFVHFRTFAVPIICIRAVPPIAVAVLDRRDRRLELRPLPEDAALSPALDPVELEAELPDGLAEADEELLPASPPALVPSDELDPEVALDAAVARDDFFTIPPHLLETYV